MPTIHRAVIKSYSPAQHRASVQIAGSLAVWLEAVPVATNIPGGHVVAGRECAVLFLTDDNPDDAVMITVHGAVPGAIDVTFDDITADTLNLTGTIIAQAPIGHVFGSGAPVDANSIISINPSGATASASKITLNVNTTFAPDTSSLNFTGFNAVASVATSNSIGAGGTTGHTVRGLAFQALINALSTTRTIAATELTGAWVAPSCVLALSTVTITTASGLVVQPSFTGSANLTITTFRSVGCVYAGSARITTMRHIELAALTAGTNQQPIYEQGSTAGDNHGNRFRSNTAFAYVGTTGVFGGGDGVLHLHNATTNPSSNPTAGVIIYSAVGDVIMRGTAGHLITLPTTTGGLSVTGSRAGNAALASLLTQLANLGFITDNTTA